MEMVNPAYNATKSDFNGLILHRNQWTGFAGAPRTTALNIHNPFKKSKFGIGLIGIYETIGLRTNSFAGLTTDITIKVGRNTYFATGLQGGIEMLGYNTENMRSYDEVPAELIKDQITPSFGTGILLFSKKFQLGASTFLSLKSNSGSNTTNNLNVNLSATYIQKLSSKWYIKPIVLGKYYTEYLNSIEGGVMMLFKDIVWFGATYRYNEAAIVFADIKVTDFLRFGYSYDASLHNVRQLNGHTHEVRLSFQIAPPKDEVKQKRSTGR